jgi:hypothetical protein
MFTPAEEKRVADYDRDVKAQLLREKEEAGRPLRKGTLKPLYDALESEALDSIKESSLDIGVLLKCKEKFKDQEIDQRVDFIVRLMRYQIEEDCNGTGQWRKEPC